MSISIIENESELNKYYSIYSKMRDYNEAERLRSIRNYIEGKDEDIFISLFISALVTANVPGDYKELTLLQKFKSLDTKIVLYHIFGNLDPIFFFYSQESKKVLGKIEYFKILDKIFLKLIYIYHDKPNELNNALSSFLKRVSGSNDWGGYLNVVYPRYLESLKEFPLQVEI